MEERGVFNKEPMKDILGYVTTGYACNGFILIVIFYFVTAEL